jgi:single-strand DNA-binding protein
MLNKATIIGRLGKDPEIKTINNQTVANFSLATTESWKNKDGEKQESTEWHNCDAWGKIAEIIEKYVKKGDLIYVEGSIKTQSWDKDGEKRYSTGISVKEMKMLGSKSSSTSQTQPEPSQPDSEGDLPF